MEKIYYINKGIKTKLEYNTIQNMPWRHSAERND